jgi:hypothetical protein
MSCLLFVFKPFAKSYTSFDNPIASYVLKFH